MSEKRKLLGTCSRRMLVAHGQSVWLRQKSAWFVSGFALVHTPPPTSQRPELEDLPPPPLCCGLPQEMGARPLGSWSLAWLVQDQPKIQE